MSKRVYLMSLLLAWWVVGSQAQVAPGPAASSLPRPAQSVALAAIDIPPLPPAAAQRLGSLMPRLQPSVRSWIQDQARRQRGLPAPDLEAIRTTARIRFSPPPPVHAAPAASFAAPRATTGKPSMAMSPAIAATPSPVMTLGSADIEALVFIVLAEASKSAAEDLKTIMDGVKAINHQKDGLRQIANDIRLEHSGAPKSDTPCATPNCKALEGRLRVLATQLPAKARFSVPPLATMGDLAGIEAKLKDSLDSMSEMGEMESMRLQMAMDRRSKMLETLSNIMKKLSDTSEAIIANLK